MKLAKLQLVLARIYIQHGVNESTVIEGLEQFGFASNETTLGAAYLKVWAQILNPQRGPAFEVPGLVSVGLKQNEDGSLGLFVIKEVGSA